MKREADGEMGSPQKRSRRGDDEVRLLIPSKVSDVLISSVLIFAAQLCQHRRKI
jgi:hypothetical protein